MAVIIVASFEQGADVYEAAQALEDAGFLKQEITVRPFDPDTALGDPDKDAGRRMTESGWDGLLSTLQRAPEDSRREPVAGMLRNREYLVMVTSDEDRRGDDATRILNQFHPREVVGRIAGNGTVDVMADAVAGSASESLAAASDDDAQCVPRAADGKFAECDFAAGEERHPAKG